MSYSLKNAPPNSRIDIKVSIETSVEQSGDLSEDESSPEKMSESKTEESSPDKSPSKEVSNEGEHVEIVDYVAAGFMNAAADIKKYRALEKMSRDSNSTSNSDLQKKLINQEQEIQTLNDELTKKEQAFHKMKYEMEQKRKYQFRLYSSC